jgi:dihydroorotate dehydrogenase
MYPFIRPLLFRLDPEAAHAGTLRLIRLGAYPPFAVLLRAVYAAPAKPVEAFGLRFRNPVGLAAGYDKDGLAWRGLAALGFGHIEVGTVTLRPQPGNPRPRLFRLVDDRGLINRMGFPGRGAARVARELVKQKPKDLILGVNLGKNKDTPLAEAARDYVELVRLFAPLADYLAINVSSPNTVGLRRLQGRELLEGLLGAIAAERRHLPKNPPVLVKLAPDLTEEELDDALDVLLRTGMDGVIATNTTLSRAGLRSPQREESGGLSGEPLGRRSLAVLQQIVKRLAGQLPVVSVGGIMSAAEATARLEAGAALVQVYTGLVYAGPGLVSTIVRAV